jgi:hypothetical protein
MLNVMELVADDQQENIKITLDNQHRRVNVSPPATQKKKRKKVHMQNL